VLLMKETTDAYNIRWKKIAQIYLNFQVSTH
jgi:hypothetical protein